MQGRPQGGVRGRGVPAGERAGVPRRGADGESVSRVVSHFAIISFAE